jgi:hypothetical protein
MDLEGELPALAEALVRQEKNPAARVAYDAMSDGLWWEDEMPHLNPQQRISIIRCIRSHRTDLILGNEGRFSGLWEGLRRLCPDWIGFSPERCQPDPELVVLIERNRRKITREIGLINRVSDHGPLLRGPTILPRQDGDVSPD